MNQMLSDCGLRGVVNIETYGYGYRKPLVLGNYPAAWAKNRRIEIQVR